MQTSETQPPSPQTEPAPANPMHARHAPLWQRLRDWIAAALHDHGDTLEYRTRRELQPLLTRIALIETVFRRLILLAATTMTIEIASRWRPEPRGTLRATAQPEPRAGQPPPRKANSSAVRIAFRLYGVSWSDGVSDAQPAGPTPPPETPADPETQAPANPVIIIRLGAGRDTLLHAGRRRRRGRTRPHPRRSTAPRCYTTTCLPDLTPEQFLAWCEAQGPLDADAAARAFREEMKAFADRQERPPRHVRRALARRRKARRRAAQRKAQQQQPHAGPASQAAPKPDLISTRPLMDRLALMAEHIRDPDSLLRRAARAFARRREIALRLAAAAVPATAGLLASADYYGTLIPLHAEFTLAMEYYAASYTEPDTS